MSEKYYKTLIPILNQVSVDQIKAVMLRTSIWFRANNYANCIFYSKGHIEITILRSKLTQSDYKKIESIINDMIQGSGELLC